MDMQMVRIGCPGGVVRRAIITSLSTSSLDRSPGPISPRPPAGQYAKTGRTRIGTDELTVLTPVAADGLHGTESVIQVDETGCCQSDFTVERNHQVILPNGKVETIIIDNSNFAVQQTFLLHGKSHNKGRDESGNVILRAHGRHFRLRKANARAPQYPRRAAIV